MFILTLRGPLGVKISLLFHLLILASGVSLYLIRNNALEALICTVVFISYILLTRYMRKHRDLLQFNLPNHSVHAFPDTQKKIKVMLLFYFFISFVFLSSTLGFLLGDSLLNGFGPNGAAFAFGYYGGSLGLIGIINAMMQKKESSNVDNQPRV